jgi:hypothetical protein
MKRVMRTMIKTGVDGPTPEGRCQSAKELLAYDDRAIRILCQLYSDTDAPI